MTGFEKQTYTQVPNSLFAIMHDMDECELKVVLYVCRYTFGYHRDEVKISTRKLAKAINMSVASVDKGANTAVGRGLIERITDGQNTTIWRAIVSDSEIESPDGDTENETPAIQKMNRSDSENESQVGVKERINKLKKNEEEEASSKTQNLFMFYTQEIGLLTPLIADALEAWEKDVPEKWIRDAISEAAKSNARNWKYIEAILKRWQAQGNQESMKKPARTNGKQSPAEPKGFEGIRQFLAEKGINNGE